RGVAQAWGQTTSGPKLYFAYLNAQGGIHGRKVVLTTFDDQYNPARTMHGVKNLQESKGIFAWLGVVGTENGLRIKDYLMNRNIPWVGPFSGARAWIDPPEKNLFAIYPQNEYEAALITRYAGEVLKKKKIAVIYQDDQYGREGLAGLKSQIKKYPEMELVAAVAIDKQEIRLSPQVQQLRQKKPDVVLLWVNPLAAFKILYLGKITGFAPIWMASTALSDYELIFEKSRGLTAGMISMNYLSRNDSEIEKYRKFWEKHKEELNIPAFTGYVRGSIGYAQVMAEGLRRCGRNVTREKFVRQLEELDNFRENTIGTISYGPYNADDTACRSGLQRLYMTQCTDQGGTRVLTDWYDLDSPIKQVNPPEM
ncbi:MAG: ABC transporter substrate-binding protein, partial [Desulfosudaceae bacterium]